MTLLTWLLAIAKALPAIIALFSTLTRVVQTEIARGRGAAEAVAAGVAKANADLVYANEVGAEADKAHMEHPTDDGGFDSDFKRDN